MPPMMLIRVLLPDPLGPINATNSPGSIDRLTPLSASTAKSPVPNCFVRLRVSMMGISRSWVEAGISPLPDLIGSKIINASFRLRTTN